VPVVNVAKLVVDHGDDLVARVLLNQSVKQNHLAEGIEASDERVRVARAGRPINLLDL